MKAVTLQATWDPRPEVSLKPDERTARLPPMACQTWRNPRLVAEDIADPAPGAEDVVIDVKACGICGSDTHCIETDDDGYVIFSGPASFPCALGHEFAGTVVEVGPSVDKVVVGDLVTSEGMLYCGHCMACKRGHVNQCFNLKMFGFSHPGAFAEYAMVHQKHCWDVSAIAEHTGDAKRAMRLASLVEPLGCAHNGMFIVGPGVHPGSHVVVFGCGPIGLGAIALAGASGAASITAFDLTEGRVKLAREMGASSAINLTDMDRNEVAESVRVATGGWGADMVVEAAGAALHTMPIIESVLAPGATVVYLGRTGERAPVMLDVLVSKAARIVGARGHAGYGIYPHFIDLLANGRIVLDSMITHTAPLSDFEAAFERSRSREDGKILLLQD